MRNNDRHARTPAAAQILEEQQALLWESESACGAPEERSTTQGDRLARPAGNSPARVQKEVAEDWRSLRRSLDQLALVQPPASESKSRQLALPEHSPW